MIRLSKSDPLDIYLRGRDALAAQEWRAAWRALRPFWNDPGPFLPSIAILRETILPCDLGRLCVAYAPARRALAAEYREVAGREGRRQRLVQLRRILGRSPLPFPANTSRQRPLQHESTAPAAFAVRYTLMLESERPDSARLLSDPAEVFGFHGHLLAAIERSMERGIVRPEFQRWLRRARKAGYQTKDLAARVKNRDNK